MSTAAGRVIDTAAGRVIDTAAGRVVRTAAGRVVRTVVVVGNPKPRSRTLEAAATVAALLTGSPADATLDLAELGPALLDWSDPGVGSAVAAVKAADVVVVASPTYKASYTGLLKVFLDRFGAGSLAGVLAIPVMLGGDLRHALAPEVFLKPVLAELGAGTPTRALFLPDSDAAAGFAASPTLQAWLERESPLVHTYLGNR